MFTGIIEELGILKDISKTDSNLTLTVQSALAAELKIDQSLSHNGVCLTITSIIQNTYKVTAIAETIKKTTIGQWKLNELLNLERCLTFNGRLDGHMVQGHVDTVGKCIKVINLSGSWQYVIEIPEKFAPLIIEKGSISLNGISLTIFDITNTSFTVAIIPYTYEHTNMKALVEGNFVNIEFDVVGKYVQRIKNL